MGRTSVAPQQPPEERTWVQPEEEVDQAEYDRLWTAEIERRMKAPDDSVPAEGMLEEIAHELGLRLG